MDNENEENKIDEQILDEQMAREIEPPKPFSKKALAKVNVRHNFALQWCWNYERMQATGMAYSLIPAFREKYKTDEEMARALERHMQFYNTNPISSQLVCGAVCALEEADQSDAAESIKIGLMGPLAGIGDTIMAVLIIPIFGTIGASLAFNGNIFGAVIFFIPMLIMFLLKWPLFDFGYKKSVSIIGEVAGRNDFDKFTEMASILGLFVIGGFIPSILGKIQTPLTYTKTIKEAGNDLVKTVKLQDALDQILPYMITVAIVGFCYWLIKKRGISPIKTIIILIIVAFVASFTHILGV